MYGDRYISLAPLSMPSVRARVEAFLAANSLRLDDVDCYVTLTGNEDSDEILAGGGLKGNVIKCVAVSPELRSEGLSGSLVSYLVGLAHERGCDTVKVFTKPENAAIFSSMGFTVLAACDKAVLMEDGNGLRRYERYLSKLRKEGRNGAIVMNANPFTKGHRYLVETAASKVDNLYVIAVKEDLSRFPYAERLAMIKAGTEDIPNVTVCEGSDYAVSAATFPTYFLKKLSDASDVQMSLDIDLFAKHIAPALGVSVRFAGSEPSDPLTARYNGLMSENLQGAGVDFVEVPRLENGEGPVSATLLREELDGGSLSAAMKFAYRTTLPYLAADLAESALRQELDTTPKPGLVDRNNSGAHGDMDYDRMSAGIRALRPWFVKMAVEAVQGLDPLKIKEAGIEAERAMLEATGGINTHKGALFCVGLTVAAASFLAASEGGVTELRLRPMLTLAASGIAAANGTHGAGVISKYRVKGALESAREAYPELFSEWLPYYRSLEGDEYRNHKTLLKIMTVLDDTNVLHRGGDEALARVKKDAAALLGDFSVRGLEELDRQYVRANISPGGSADMLSLTIFISTIINN